MSTAAPIVLPSPDEVIAVVRLHQDFPGAFKLMQERLGLANEEVEDHCDFSRGHVDKYLGPSQVKTMGEKTFNEFVGALAVEFHAHLNVEGARVMAGVWEGRKRPLMRVNASRLSMVTLDRAKDAILRAQMRDAQRVRNERLSGEERSAIARKAAMARWSKRRRKRASNLSPAHLSRIGKIGARARWRKARARRREGTP